MSRILRLTGLLVFVVLQDGRCRPVNLTAGVCLVYCRMESGAGARSNCTQRCIWRFVVSHSTKTHVPAHPQAQAQVQLHVHAQAHAHMHTHTHTYTHMHTYTHNHNHLAVLYSSRCLRADPPRDSQPAALAGTHNWRAWLNTGCAEGNTQSRI